MAGLYFHIPFCKQACHYCNFHFSTKQKNRTAVLTAMAQELSLRAPQANFTNLESIYFGGGSPSLLSPQAIGDFLQQSKGLFTWSPTIEITVELNPDDVSREYILALSDLGVNRVSLGVQSFFASDLELMNRAHNAQQVMDSLGLIQAHFKNFSIDLIYGIPGQSLADWELNLANALAFHPPHISAYALTVEPKTVLEHQVAQQQVILLAEEEVKAHFDGLVNILEAKGYDHYESSNFGKEGFYSVNNTAYWQRKPYVGIGPSAHSYNGTDNRSWNVSNNHSYVKALNQQKLAQEQEVLSTVDRYNEAVMTGLRTQWGVSLAFIAEHFGKKYAQYLEEQASKYLAMDNLYWDGDHLKVRKQARFLVDGLAADLFLINWEGEKDVL
ncbi:MAG: radical SAM family heme chaperone HemW [Flavobacteriaceae bacterium]